MDYSISPTLLYILPVLLIWDLVWRGLALWRSARNNQSTWFVVLLAVNSAGFLPIIYLLTHKQKKWRSAS